MPEPAMVFAYVAVDEAGRRVRGEVQAADDAEAFVQLKQLGLSPVEIRAAHGRRSPRAARRAQGLGDREITQFLSSLAALLKAGADMRTALDILSRTMAGSGASFARRLSADISGGGAIDVAFEQHLPGRADFVGALIAAGEASGDLAGGLERASELMSARLRLRDQLVSVLSYPVFVFASTLLAIAAILLVVIPTLSPLVEDMQGKAPFVLAVMIGVSNALRSHLAMIVTGAGALVLGGLLAWRAGLLSRPFEVLLLDGPFSAITRRVVFGGYAVALGSVLSGSASMSDALRLSTRAVRLGVGRVRLEPVAASVREGGSLSAALESVRGFPAVIAQLAAVGEASGALGPMLERAGRLEEAEALRRVEAIGRVLGPMLIVGLGAIIGLVMAGLLSGVTRLGQIAAG